MHPRHIPTHAACGFMAGYPFSVVVEEMGWGVGFWVLEVISWATALFLVVLFLWQAPHPINPFAARARGD
jgi:hypothetical protein